ncbi:MAG: dienelactone hydrolase family protein [Gammaproteobacteria bacterium]|nr:MAG: dienelactone hydrolase family protein [Gammaproteobacteria bacterium]
MRVLIFILFAALATAAAADEASDRDYALRMAEAHASDKAVSNEASKTRPARAVTGKAVAYASINGKAVEGYLAHPADQEGPLPAIIVIQEWWGLNDNIRAMADRFAGEGYAALAVDLYNGQVATDSQGARTLMREAMANPDTVEDNLRQAYAYLSDTLAAPSVGTVGWCFGGGWSLGTALMFPDQIDATVIYYGRLVTDPEQLEPLQMPILGLFGAEDQGIPVESVREFENALNELGKDATIVVYDGANHAFANPTGTRYNAEAAADAWEKTTAFFAKNLH